MKKRRGHANRGFSRKSRTQTRPSLERFEDRLLLTVFTVTSTADSTTATSGDGSLRGEILASNASTTALPNQIEFDLPAGSQAIAPVATLPTITEPVTIDGTSATGFDPTNPKPLIAISGSTSGTTGPGFTATVAGVVFSELIIDNWNGDGIDLDAVGGDTVSGCYIGVNPAGTAKAANSGVGILVSSPNNIIGSTATNPNVISGNFTGIQITGSNSTANTIIHNYIGTDVTGTIKIPNSTGGILDDSPNNTIGGVSSNGPGGLGNLISGNTLDGLDINNVSGTSLAPGAVVEGNYIGTDVTGELALANTNLGLDIFSSADVQIGGSVAGAGNVISANGLQGVDVVGSGSSFDTIVGNLIGTDAKGTSALGNGFEGILDNGASFVTIGGTDLTGDAPQYGNVIANNGLTSDTPGILVLGATNVGILSNSIYNNGAAGIQLSSSNSGVTAPTLLTADSGAGQTRITGTYFGAPNTDYRIQFFSNQVPNSSGFGDGQNYLGDLDITTDASGDASFTTTLSIQVPLGEYLSTTATQGPLVTNNTSEFGNDVQVGVADSSDMAVTTMVPTAGPFLDQDYSYTLKVTNNGPDDATGVILTDTIPQNSSFIASASSSGTFAGGVFTDDIGDLASGSFVDVTVTVLPSLVTSSFVNTATVTSDNLDPNTTNNNSTTTESVLANADLSVILTPSETLAPVGSPLTYTLNIGNSGPSIVNNAVVTVSFPASFSGLVVMPDQGTYTIDSNNTVTINTGILAASSSSTDVFQAVPNDTGTATVTATVTSTIPDPNTANNTATSNVTIANAADLAVTLTGSAPTVLIGDELLYTAEVTNNGPSAASEPVVLDQLPQGLTYVAADSSAGPNGTISYSNGLVTASLPALLAGTSQDVTIAVMPTASGSVTNTVTVGDPNETNPVEIDTNLANNTSSTTTLVSPADIGVAILNPTDPLFIGTQAVYQLVVDNNGPAAATNVILKDTLGAGATIVSASAGTISGNAIVANLGTLASGTSTTITFTVAPTASVVLLDNASVTSDEIDPNPDDNTASSTNLVSPVDLAVTAAATPNPVLIGSQLTYVFTVTNNGPATATNVLFNNTLPANVAFDSLSTSQGSLAATNNSIISGNLGSLAPGASATITVVVTPGTVETAINTATVTSDNVESNSSNNTVSTSTSVINLPGALEFASPLSLVAENAGSISLTIGRVGGSLGAVTIDYATSDYTAVAGVNYVQTDGTVSFADGQTSATITIPILDDNMVDGDYGFFVTLSNPTGGASVGTPDVAGVLVTNTDRDLIPPIVTSLVAIPNGSSIDGFVITFDKAMNLSTIALASNYHLFSTNGSGGQSPIAIAGVVYNPTTFAVTIIPTSPLPSNKFYHVIANGSIGNSLTDASGNRLYGSEGVGTNYDAYYGQGTDLTYTDSKQNSVKIQLTGGGTLSIFRSANGDALAVNIYDTVAHKSKLSGSVRKLNKFSSGYTTIGSIEGFGVFGDIYSALTTPDFYVESAPVTVESANVSSEVSALAVPTTNVTQKSKTPKGPRRLVN